MAEINHRVVELNGDVTLANLETIHGSIRAALASCANVTIDCSPLGETDISLLQMLVAASRTKGVTLQGPLPESVSALLRRCGLPLPDDRADRIFSALHGKEQAS